MTSAESKAPNQSATPADDVAFEPGGAAKITSRIMDALHVLAQPKLYDIENVPTRGPFLLVGNHTLFGVFDAPSLYRELERRRGVYVRSLADYAHWKIPIWRDLLKKHGAVCGTPEAGAALLRAGEAVLVFPGGAREVYKRKDQLHSLVWGDRLGFTRLAIEHGCPIVPFAAVGGDDVYEILLDADHFLMAPFRAASKAAMGRGDIVLPVVRGVGASLIPRPERLYFHFSPPIETARFGARADEANCVELRDLVKHEIETGIDLLLAIRENDPKRNILRRAGHAVGGLLNRG